MELMEKSKKCIWKDDLEDNIKMEDYYNFGIFANPVGSGKTICMLELIRRNKMKKNNIIQRISSINHHGFIVETRKIEN